jgi:hypothetical protein
MKFVPITRDELPVSGRPTSRSATLFKDFLESGVELTEIQLDEDDKTPESVRSSLDNYIVRHDLPVTVFTRAGRLFIEKSDTKPSERPKKVRKSKADAEGTDVGDGTADVNEVPEGVELVDEAAEYAGV